MPLLSSHTVAGTTANGTFIGNDHMNTWPLQPSELMAPFILQYITIDTLLSDIKVTNVPA